MTPAQFKRWRDFALRMARTHYGKPRRARVVDGVRIPAPSPAWIADTVADIIDGLECVAPRITDWDGDGAEHGEAVYVCDVVAEETCHGDALRAEPEQFDENGRGPAKAWEAWDAMWRGPVNCCVRAGLDVASKPSMYGVIGFKVRDLRRMYPKGIPAWIARGFTDDEGKPVDLNRVAASRGVHL